LTTHLATHLATHLGGQIQGGGAKSLPTEIP
jgi:hypothetical protein